MCCKAQGFQDHRIASHISRRFHKSLVKRHKLGARGGLRLTCPWGGCSECLLGMGLGASDDFSLRRGGLKELVVNRFGRRLSFVISLLKSTTGIGMEKGAVEPVSSLLGRTPFSIHEQNVKDIQVEGCDVVQRGSDWQ